MFLFLDYNDVSIFRLYSITVFLFLGTYVLMTLSFQEHLMHVRIKSSCGMQLGKDSDLSDYQGLM